MLLRAGSLAAKGCSCDFVTQGNNEQPLPHQGQEIVFHPVGITGIVEALGDVFSEPITLVQLPE